MGKKKKSHKSSSKKSSFTHTNPFKEKKSELLKSLKQGTKKEEEEKVTPTPRDTGEDAWERYHAGIKPFSSDTVPTSKPKNDPKFNFESENDLVRAELNALVSGDADFELEFLNEFVTGLAPGIDRRLLTKLKKGEFSYQAHLDLHRMIWADARQIILDFITDSIRKGHRCVLIIHGRGLHSKGPVAILKEQLINLLVKGPLKKKVLAFSTARSVDGGPGSIYILLRKSV